MKVEVLDFAQFLETRAAAGNQERVTIDAADARRDALLASEESQRLLEKLADEALADLEAGKARSIRFTDAGEIALG